MLQHRGRRAGVESLHAMMLLDSVPLAGAESDLSRYSLLVSPIRYSLLVIVAAGLLDHSIVSRYLYCSVYDFSVTYDRTV